MLRAALRRHLERFEPTHPALWASESARPAGSEPQPSPAVPPRVDGMPFKWAPGTASSSDGGFPAVPPRDMRSDEIMAVSAPGLGARSSELGTSSSSDDDSSDGAAPGGSSSRLTAGAVPRRAAPNLRTGRAELPEKRRRADGRKVTIPSSRPKNHGGRYM